MSIDEVYKKLKADFPKEAYSVDNTRGFPLTSIKAQYVIERLNDVLGLDGWSIDGEFEKDENGVAFIGSLNVKIGDKEVTRSGVGYGAYQKDKDGNLKKSSIGDAFKSAMTDMISKTASHIGVGNEVFKGNVDPAKLDLTTVTPSNGSSYKKNTWGPAKKTVSTNGTGDFA